MFFNIIASGSKGNATLVMHKNTLILIDFGVSLERLNEGLAEINKSIKDITGAIFTHNHIDHIRSIKSLSPKIMYALDGTLTPLSNVVELNKEFKIGDISIIPFKTSHDATNPCGYLLKADNESLVYMTDTGMFIEDNLSLIYNPTYLIIESNHDIKMLLKSDRSLVLKQRIMSDVGHLCNEDSAFAACLIIGKSTKEIVLAHLSEECNTPELALEAYQKVFEFKNIDINKISLKTANQWSSLIGGHYEN